MGTGISILLIAAGAILAFGVDASVQGLDLDVVGWVLMGAGVLGLVWSLVLLTARRREVVIEPRHSPAHVVAPADQAGAPQVRAEAADDPRGL
jgi:hypothetical protein